jgi:acetyl-CoA C-acetyltransferase
MDNSHQPVILSAARTPQGSFRGVLSPLSATELGAAAVKAAVERAGLEDTTQINEVYMGNVLTAGVGQAPARQAAIFAGLPSSVGATTLNKVCGSGLKAVMLAASEVRAGQGDLYVAGGMESMSRAPFLVNGRNNELRYGNVEMVDAIYHDGLHDPFEKWVMGDAADFIGEEYEVTRQAMDEFACDSHRKAHAATQSGAFRDEIVPVDVPGRKGEVTSVETDEPIRPDTSVEILARLRPAFKEDGRVTAGNAPGLNDGAAALIVASRTKAGALGAKPLARIVGYNHVAVDPKTIFIAPARAVPALLQKVGWSAEEVDLYELNEAFAAQVLADGYSMIEQGHKLDWDKVNVNGGAIALGHPLGASGARVLTTLIYALKARGLKRGIASLCLGGGEAVAMAIEIED